MSIISPEIAEVSERRWVIRLGLAFVVLSLLLHLPGLMRPLYDADEASLASIAMVLEHGGTMYHETADRKPPIVPYIYAAVFTVTRTHDIRPVRALSDLTLAATALLLALEARRRTASRNAGVACGVLFLLATVAFLPGDSQAAGFELFMLLPITAAVILAGRGRAVGAGLCLAIACLCKQTAAVTALPVALLLFREANWRAVFRAGAVAFAVVAATALAFGPGPFILWVFTGNVGYVSARDSVFSSVVRGAWTTAAFVALNGVLVWFCVVAWRRRAIGTDLWLWLAGSAVAVAAGYRFFGHYFFQLLPPLALMAAGGLPQDLRTWRRAAGGVLVPVVGMWGYAYAPPINRGLIPYTTVAREVQALTTPSEKIFVWGEYPEVYWAADRLPSTRFVHTGFLTGNSGGRDPLDVRASDGIPGGWTMLESDMVTSPPALIVDTTAAYIRQSEHHPLDQTPIWADVQSHYVRVATVDRVRFYRRVS